MHRSGTSAVTGVLNLLGAAAPASLMTADAFNERGYFESTAIMALNDSVFASLGSEWQDWRPIDRRWFEMEQGQRFRDEARALLLDEYREASLIALKDPRICRIAPLWLGALRDAGYKSKAIIVVRNPVEVAFSLWKRDGGSVAHGLLMWLRHVLDSEFDSRGMNRSVVIWSELLRSKSQEYSRALAEVGLGRLWGEDQSSRIRSFLSDELHHNRMPPPSLEDDPSVNDWVLSTYRCMQTLSTRFGSPTTSGELDRTREEFDRSARLYGPVIAARAEQIGDLTAALEATKQDAERKGIAEAQTRELMHDAERQLVARESDLAGLRGALAQAHARAELAEARADSAQQEAKAANGRAEVARRLLVDRENDLERIRVLATSYEQMLDYMFRVSINCIAEIFKSPYWRVAYIFDRVHSLFRSRARAR